MVHIVVDKPKLWDAQTVDGQFAAGVVAAFSSADKARTFAAGYSREVYPKESPSRRAEIVVVHSLRVHEGSKGKN